MMRNRALRSRHRAADCRRLKNRPLLVAAVPGPVLIACESDLATRFYSAAV